jgi:hypothetical protein
MRVQVPRVPATRRKGLRPGSSARGGSCRPVAHRDEECQCDGIPGSVTLHDDCLGGATPPSNAFNFSSLWSLSSLPGLCTLTITATSLQGAGSQASARYILQ